MEYFTSIEKMLALVGEGSSGKKLANVFVYVCHSCGHYFGSVDSLGNVDRLCRHCANVGHSEDYGLRRLVNKPVDYNQICAVCCNKFVHTEFTSFCLACLAQRRGEGYTKEEDRSRGFAVIDLPQVDTSIYEYNYKPAPKFFGRARNSLYLGFEVELSNRGRYSSTMCESVIPQNLCSEMFYYKRDSSVNNGFELVTHPMSYRHFVNSVEMFNELFHKMNRLDYYSDYSCGFHVHISKKAFTRTHMHKFLMFFYHNQDMIKALSGREEGNFNEWCNFDSEGITRKAKFMTSECGDRHTAVNMYPRRSVEVRCFSGVDNTADLVSNVEFIVSVYEFTKEYPNHAINPVKYYEFIKASKYRGVLQFFKNNLWLIDIKEKGRYVCDSFGKNEVLSNSKIRFMKNRAIDYLKRKENSRIRREFSIRKDGGLANIPTKILPPDHVDALREYDINVKLHKKYKYKDGLDMGDPPPTLRTTSPLRSILRDRFLHEAPAPVSAEEPTTVSAEEPTPVSVEEWLGSIAIEAPQNDERS